MLKKSIELAPDGDFSKDAKKQLQVINGQFAAEGDTPEVQVNVPSAQESSSQSSSPRATASSTAPAATEQSNESDGTEPKKKGLFSKKSHKNKNVNMVVSPQPDASAGGDLQAKPAN
jgi:hypothetical protein